MKKMKKRILALLTAMVMLLTAIPVSAEEVYVDIPQKACCMRVAPGDKQMKSYVTLIGTVMGTKKVSVKSSNTKVATVKKLPLGPGANGVMIQAYGKKNGTSTITVKVGKKSYKCRFTMCNYQNPFSYVKIGKYKISGSKFNKTATNKSLRYSSLAGKNTKVQVKLKKGWKVEGIMYNMKKPTGNMMPDMIGNGQSVKVRGGAGSSFYVTCYNAKLGLRQGWEIVLR